MLKRFWCGLIGHRKDRMIFDDGSLWYCSRCDQYYTMHCYEASGCVEHVIK